MRLSRTPGRRRGPSSGREAPVVLRETPVVLDALRPPALYAAAMTSVQPLPAAGDGLRLDGDAAAAATTRLVLTITAAANAVLVAVLVVLAVLVDGQSDILAARSEAGGGFDPSVFPPFDDAIWVLANGAAALAVVILVVLVVLRVVLGRRRSR